MGGVFDMLSKKVWYETSAASRGKNGEKSADKKNHGKEDARVKLILTHTSVRLSK